MPQIPYDPAAGLLARSRISNRLRADAWDAFHDASDEDDLATRLRGLDLPDSVRADLWDLKVSGQLRPVSAEDFTDQSAPKGSAAGRFVRGAWEMLNPAPMVKGIASALSQPTSPEDAVLGPLAGVAPLARGALAQQIDQFKRAGDALDQGRYYEAGGHALAGAVPLVGPAAAGAAEQIVAGDVAGGAGKAAGLLLPVAIGAGLRAAAPKAAIGSTGVLPVADAEAMAFADRTGIPVDAATATSNKFVKAIQHASDRSLAGSLVAHRAGAVQAERLATVGEQLAAKANPDAVTAADAGRVARAGVGRVVRGQRMLADDAYDRLRAIEADPANATVYQPTVGPPSADAPHFFSMKPKPTADELFQDVLRDARANGYKGRVGDLRAQFDQRMASAKSLRAATAEGDEYSHAALLKEIRSRGGLRPFDLDFEGGAPTRIVREESQGASHALRKYYGKNAVMRTDGVPVDAMVQQLSEDPKWGAVITPETDLRAVIESGSFEGAHPGADIQGYLRGVGVQPGSTWWQEGAKAQTVPMAVDVASVKEAWKPLYERLRAKKEITGSLMGTEGTMAARLGALIDGPDLVPVSVADSALSDLKRIARSNNPDLRTPGQGLAAEALKSLHQRIDEAAERAGPDAVAALREGRLATQAKYAAGAVLKRLEGAQGTKTPTATFRGMTQGGDGAHLREVLRESPDAKPAIARAVLDGLINHPTAGAAKTWADWQRLGPEVKNLLFEPAHQTDLNQFFKLRKMIADNPNPSGSGHTALAAIQGGLLVYDPIHGTMAQLASGALSTLLHSRAGVKLLTQGFRIPIANKAAATAWASNVAALTSPSGSQMRTAPAR